MEPPEFHKHRIRTQLLKIIGHLREARMELNRCDDHMKYVQNASEIEALATLQLETKVVPQIIQNLNDEITKGIDHCVNQAAILQSAMANPNNKMPPIVGRFLSLSGLTRTQKILATEGHLPYSDQPTHHFVIDPNQQRKPAKPRKLPDVIIIKQKPRRKKRNEMPI